MGGNPKLHSISGENRKVGGGGVEGRRGRERRIFQIGATAGGAG